MEQTGRSRRIGPDGIALVTWDYLNFVACRPGFGCFSSVGRDLGEIKSETTAMLEINRSIRIPLSEFHWMFVRSGGPGGQNVNKVASKAVLRWNVKSSPSLPEEVKARLRAQQHWRITVGGDFMITSQKYREQERNRQDCLEKLSTLLRAAAVPPKPRKRTKPTAAAQYRRLEDKRCRARTKQARRTPSEE
jgi:ribosome-associated protein